MTSSNAIKRTTYKMRSLEDNNIVVAGYELLINRAEFSERSLDDAEKVVEEQYVKDRADEEWQTYLKCDHSVHPYEPDQIRNFFYKTFKLDQDDVEHSINWILAVDERSILTQDLNAPNKTYACLHKNKLNFGKRYDEHVNDAIKILNDVVRFVRKPDRKVSTRIMKDIEHMKFFTFQQVSRYIDHLTYRILSSEKAYMDEIDITSAKYAYPGNHFAIHLWTFKDVPIYLDPVVMPFYVVDLHQINVEVSIPFSVLYPNMVVRGLHCYFDHFSEHVRFNEIPKNDNIILNLKDSLAYELKAQLALQEQIKNTLIRLHKEYEEEMRVRAEEEEMRAKQKKLAEESKDPKVKKTLKLLELKLKKPIKEPQYIPPGYVPVVHEEFLEYDSMQFGESLKPYNPANFHLTPGEVNLRKYQILGGVYQINFLEKPQTVKIPHVIMSWYKSDKNIKFHDFKAEKPPRNDDELDETKFFQITFTLPQYFCYWGRPLPCLFEEGTNIADAIEKSEFETSNLKPHVVTPVIINDFNLSEVFDKPLMYKFIESTIPRILSTFQFPHDIHKDDDVKKAKTGFGKLTAAQLQREQELAMERQMYSFKDQHSPERLFPLFKKVLPVIIMPAKPITEPDPDEELKLKEKEKEKEKERHTARDAVEVEPPYKCFSDFFSTLENIKENYQTSTFLDRFGKPMKIKAEYYEKGYTRPKKPVVIDKISLTAESTLKKSLGRMSKKNLIATEPKKASKATEVLQNVVSYQEEKFPENVTKWSTINILKSEFKPQERKVTIWTDRLGTFGLAFYRYQHFPFVNWEMHPHPENPQDVELVLQSIYAVFRFQISAEGYRVIASDFSKLSRSRLVYIEIKEPTTDLLDIKQKMQQKYLNVFPECDYSFYTTGYFREKHVSTENHLYNCLSLYATSLKFKASTWNKLADRRTMLLQFGELRDSEENLLQISIVPEKVLFVDVTEVCTDLDRTVLEFTPTWRNLELYSDFNYLVKSMFNNADDMLIKNQNIIFNLTKLLRAIRPLSCS